MKLNERDLKRLLRRAVLGVSAAPLLILPGCGREPQPNFQFNPNASVIPDRDPETRDSNFDAGLEVGFDAGFDAGTDAGFVRGSDAGSDGGFEPCLEVGLDDAGTGGRALYDPDGGARIYYDAGTPDGGWRIVLNQFCANWVQTCTGPFNKDPGLFLQPDACVVLCPHDSYGNPLPQCSPLNSNDLVCWITFCGTGGRLAAGVNMHAGGSGVGRILGDMAAHEAAAVVAFEQLAVELSRHALPEALRRAALRAADEERRHTRLVGALARRRGGRFGISGSRTEVRSLEEIALDNAVEGCARETFGAMVGLYQSMHAPDPAVRAVMASVSEDELGHSSWSWALHEALAPRLSRQARRKIRGARDEALATLTRGLLAGKSEAERAELGMPDEERLESMAASLREELYC